MKRSDWIANNLPVKKPPTDLVSPDEFMKMSGASKNIIEDILVRREILLRPLAEVVGCCWPSTIGAEMGWIWISIFDYSP